MNSYKNESKAEINLELSELMDVSAIQDLMNDYYALTGIGIGIIDMKGKVLVKTGWQDVCINFHRAFPESCKFCIESDTCLSQNVPPGTFREYQCKNNMWDIATPIMIGNIHIGNIFLGQFLYDDEVPDLEIYRYQARQFGYNEEAYLAALNRVPRYSREKIQTAMSFYSKLAKMISKSSYENLILKNSILERSRTEKQLKDLIQRNELATSSARLAVWDWNVRENIMVWDDQMFKLYSIEKDPSYSNFDTWVSRLHPDDKDKAIKATQAALKGEKKFDLTFRIQCPDNTIKYIKANALVINGADGIAERMIGINMDVSESKRLEESLIEKERFLQEAQSIAHLGSYTHDFISGEWTPSPELVKIFGIDKSYPRTVEGWLGVVHPDSRTTLMNYFEQLGKEVKRFNLEYKIKRINDHEIRWVHGLGELEYGPNPSIPVRMIGTIQDITERKLAEEQLKESEERFREIVETTDCLVTTVDSEGLFHYINETAEKIIGIKNIDLLGRMAFDFIHLEDKSKTEKWFNDCVARKISQSTIENRLVNVFTGAVSHMLWTCKFLYDEKGNIKNVGSIAYNITERKLAEEKLLAINAELKAAKESAEWAMQSKSRFLDIAAHELRTPVTSFYLIVQLAQKMLSEGHPVGQSILDRLRVQAERISRLVIDLLDVSRLERDIITLQLEYKDVASLVNECLNDFKMRVPGKKIVFNDSPGIIEIKIDAVRIIQVISNLLDNSAKYTPEDSPLEISIEAKNDFVRISIKDFGPGISIDQQAGLFEPFTRISTERTERSGGLGLGLYICRKIIELHGGKIGLESQLGVGCTFYFELPIS